MKKEVVNPWLLVNFRDNWGNCMVVEGGRIYSKTEWDNFCKTAKMEFDKNGFFVYYVDGTNEKVDYSSYKEFMSCFEVKGITIIDVFPENFIEEGVE